MSKSHHIADQESRIKESLFKFVQRHIPKADLGLIDEIVLSYVVAILEDVSSDPVFDVEGFCDMMSAYFPEFRGVNHAAVCQWMFELEAELQEAAPPVPKTPPPPIELSLPEILPRRKPRASSESECSEERPRRVHQVSETSDGGSTDSESDLLQEMFPDACSLEVRHCLAIAGGDLERAAQVLLYRQENDLSLLGHPYHPSHHFSPSQHPHHHHHHHHHHHVVHHPLSTADDTEVKNRIIERYSLVDKDADSREHRPLAPKAEPKKMVRYRDNKIVSLKGERYTEVRKGEEPEDVTARKPPKKA